MIKPNVLNTYNDLVFWNNDYAEWKYLQQWNHEIRFWSNDQWCYNCDQFKVLYTLLMKIVGYQTK